jgi:hypothetical protein
VRPNAQPGNITLKMKSLVMTCRASLKVILWPGGIIELSSFHETLLPNPRNGSVISQNENKRMKVIPAAPITKSAIYRASDRAQEDDQAAYRQRDVHNMFH